MLRKIGVDGTAPDGAPQLQFHLTSAPAHWIAINRNDVNAWLDGTETAAGQPRLLKLSDPPMHGSDVKSVQRALAVAKISVEWVSTIQLRPARLPVFRSRMALT